MSLPPDWIDLLAEFGAEGVDYLLIGGHAVALHGRPSEVWGQAPCSGTSFKGKPQSRGTLFLR